MRTIDCIVQDACPGGGGAGRFLRVRPISVLLSLLILTGFMAMAACSPEPASKDNADYPLTVNDFLGQSVQFDRTPERIVTTHPTATEILCCAGGLPVGRDGTSTYPPDVEGLPTVGTAFYLSVEDIAALKPDLIIIEALTQARFMNSLSPLGVPVIAVRATCLEDIVESMTMVGQIIDRSEEAESSIASMKGRIADAQSACTSDKSVVVLIADGQKKTYAAREDSYPGSVAALLGLDNLAAGFPESGPYAGFAEITAEQMAVMNPEVFLTITPSPFGPRLSVLLSSLPGYKDKAAVNEGRVVELDSSLYLMAQGPRIASAVEGLAEIMNGYE